VRQLLLKLGSAVLIATRAAVSAGAVDAQADAPILATVQAFSDARARFDGTALATLLAPDYVEVSPRGEVDSRSAVLSFYTPDKAGPAPRMTLTTDLVQRHGDTAIVIGTISYMIASPSGEAMTRTVRVTYVEQRIQGRWLMASTQFTGVQPARADLPGLKPPR
jgi:uncharacterized protein (TIGR02246 family)